MDAEHPAVARKQEAVKACVVLVWLSAEEGLQAQAVRADDEPSHGGELVLARQLDKVRTRLRVLEGQVGLRERTLDDPRGVIAGSRGGHASTAAATCSSMASVYTFSSRSTVPDQPN